MRFENTFEVQAPVDRVWDTILDVERVAPTVPGAEVLEQTSDTAYKVGIKVKLGPMTMQYKADVEVVEADDDAHRAVMKVRAKESRGQGTADAEATMQLTGENGRTTGTIVTEVKVSGKAASMGRGVMQDVAGRMVGTFAENLATLVEGDSAEAPAEESPGEAEAKPEPEAAQNGSPRTAAPTGAATAGGGEDALDLGELGGAMLLERLKDPKVIAGLVLVFLVLRRLFR